MTNHLYWRKEDTIKRLENNIDRQKLGIFSPGIVDVRPVVAANKDFIFEVAEKLGIWAPYKTTADVARAHLLPLQEVGKISVEHGADMHAHFAPCNDIELNLVEQYLKSL